jgi:hypothetical protein
MATIHNTSWVPVFTSLPVSRPSPFHVPERRPFALLLVHPLTLVRHGEHCNPISHFVS